MSIQLASAEDFEYSINQSELPFYFNKSHVLMSDENSTVNSYSSTSWINLNDTYYFNNTDELDITIFIQIPTNTGNGNYSENVTWITDYNATDTITFLFEIYGEEVFSGNITNLTITVKNGTSGNIINGSNVNIYKTGTSLDEETNSEGKSIFSNIETGCWEITASYTGYVNHVGVECVQPGIEDSYIIYLQPETIQYQNLTEDEKYDILRNCLDEYQTYVDEEKENESFIEYIENVTYRTQFEMSEELWEKIVNGSPQRSEDLQSVINSKNSQIDLLVNKINYDSNESANLASFFNTQLDMEKNKSKGKIHWSIPIVIGILAGLFIYFKFFDKKVVYVG